MAVRKADLVAFLEIRNSGTRLYDGACTLVTENGREGEREKSESSHLVGMADTAGGDFNKYFAFFWLAELDVFNRNTSFLLLGYSSFDVHFINLL